MSLWVKGLLIWLAAVNLALFAAMGADKRRAIRQRRRIPERTLFLLCLLGGGIGGLLGMRLFRHKTRHWSFRLGFPLILLAQGLLAGVFLWYRP